jgi:hypothetical protein
MAPNAGTLLRRAGIPCYAQIQKAVGKLKMTRAVFPISFPPLFVTFLFLPFLSLFAYFCGIKEHH